MNNRTIIEKIVFGAMFASVAVVIKIFINYETPAFRLSFYEFPIMLSSILLGPIYGGMVGLITDLNYIIMNPRAMNVGINWFTLECVTLGVLPGLFFHFFRYNKVKLAIILFVTMAFGLLFNSLGVLTFNSYAVFMGTLPWRILRDVIKYPIYFYLIHLFLTDQRFLSFNFFRRFSNKHKVHEDSL